MTKYTDAKFPDKINDLIDNDGNVKPGSDVVNQEELAEHYYTKEEVDQLAATVYRYMGSVDSFSDLPSEGQKIGDTYNVLDTGDNYAWDGEDWDKLAGAVIANPTGTPTDSLQTLRVGSIVYSIPQGDVTTQQMNDAIAAAITTALNTAV